MKQITFGKGMSTTPLLISLGIGIVLALICMIFLPTIAALIVGIAIFLLLTLWYYPTVLPLAYGRWTAQDEDFTAYAYDSWSQRVKAVFAGRGAAKQQIAFKDVAKIDHCQGRSIVDSKETVSASDTPELSMPWLSKTEYLLITMKDGRKIKLNLSADKANQAAYSHSTPTAKTVSDIESAVAASR